MSNVIECDICGKTYERHGFPARFARIDVPYRYKLYDVIPYNRDEVGFVQQDVCKGCKDEFEKAVAMLKEKHND